MSGKKSYHHGDLRAALIETGLRLLDEAPGETPGLREVARETGVSATAVYRHFPNKQALLAALAAEGYERLGTVQEAAGEGMPELIDRFRAAGRAYATFAFDHPALFGLMSSHLKGEAKFADERNRAARLLHGQVAALLPHASEEARQVAAVQAWALVHGLAVLMLGGQLPRDEALIAAAVNGFGEWR